MTLRPGPGPSPYANPEEIAADLAAERLSRESYAKSIERLESDGHAAPRLLASIRAREHELAARMDGIIVKIQALLRKRDHRS